MADRMGVLRRVIANSRLRSVECAFFGFGAAEYGVWIAVLVYAYERGGTTASAVVAVAQLLPAAVVAPLASVIADRRGAALALQVGYVAQALSIGAGAVAILLSAPAAVVYAGAIVAASAVTLTRPAQGALLPVLVDTPAELTAANVASGWVESLSLLVGPALAGALIAVDGPGAALAMYALVVAVAAALVTPLRRCPGRASAASIAPVLDEPASPVEVIGVIRTTPGVAGVLAVVAVEFVAIGALDVLGVVLAIHVLGLGAGAAGYLGAAFGAGAVLGAVAAIALVGRRRLTGALLGAALAWGGAFVAIGIWPTVAGAFVLLAACGASRTVLDVAARTMLHRAVAPAMHGRVFGVLEGLAMLGLAVGSLSVPLLVDMGGAAAPWLWIGGVIVVVALAARRTLRAVDRGAAPVDLELGLLRRHPVFGLLPAPVLEDLARALVLRAVAAGEAVVREGEPASDFYVIAVGAMEVSAGGRVLRTLETAAGFGDIALLGDGRRTATVRALVPSLVYALDREPFLDAVTGSHHVRRAAETLVAEQLQGAAVHQLA